MLIEALAVAWAGGSSNLAVHTVGAQGAWSGAVGAGDVDLLVGERLRWGLGEHGQLDVDVRFIVDPAGPARFERYRVRRLGTTWTLGAVTLQVGRQLVRDGGPRLVDGAQLLVAVDAVEVGFWAGLAPDLFTTAPRLRPGFGPVVSWTSSQARASVAGEAVFADGGLDRAGVLASARYAPGRAFAVDGRLDVELASAEGGPHLSDGRLSVSGRPAPAVRVGAFYDAFSSFRYLRTEALDPALRRFDARILEQGLADGFDQDTRDPFVNHLVGGDLRVRDPGERPAPLFEFAARYRHHPDAKNRFTTATARAGMTRIGGRGELSALAVLRRVDAVLQSDVGAQVALELGDGCCAIDGSALALFDPARVGTGFYGDLFADVVSLDGIAFGGGLNVLAQPEPYAEAGVSAFARMTVTQRRDRAPR